jgi:hypothetical protein
MFDLRAAAALANDKAGWAFVSRRLPITEFATQLPIRRAAIVGADENRLGATK